MGNKTSKARAHGSTEAAYAPPASGSTEEGAMVCLVKRGDPRALTFEHAHGLRGKKPTALTLASHPGKAVVPRYDWPRESDEWRFIELGIGPAHMAMVVQLQDNFLVRLHDERVFDIAHWYILSLSADEHTHRALAAALPPHSPLLTRFAACPRSVPQEV
jgi:hypothetical protein